ncbi:hypothetical protein CHS0354_017359 [Potamilus streckersoni]|uniref:MI domain-containing protein n=1 Tax=Potamilus streckersoni TaxID=2493646 RepID=A0AAE0T4H0_9BIVA|nr:hypothetical protein CHS0354_017359 [Potamilus streckersoni]
MGKRKQLSRNDPPNLKRFRASILEFTSQYDPVDDSRDEQNSSTVRRLGRKERRKEARQMKKARNLAYSQRKPIPTQDDIEKEKREMLQKKKKSAKLKRSKAIRKEKKARKKIQEQKGEEVKRRELELEASFEEKEIKRLEKKLRLNKRKSKSLPMSFINDGLDFLLADLGEEKDTALPDREMYLRDSDSELSDNNSDEKADISDNDNLDVEDMEDVMEEEEEGEEEEEDLGPGGSIQKSPLSLETVRTIRSVLKLEKKRQEEINEFSKGKQVRFDNDCISKEEDDNEEEYKEEEETEKVREEEEKEVELFNIDLKNKTTKSGGKTGNDLSGRIKEDIYGRLRDEEGNIVQDPLRACGTYIPPAKRLMVAEIDENKKQQLARLKKQMKGLINRASENNMQPISSQIEELYMSNSRADVNSCLISIILEACVSPVLTPERLTMELMMLVAILHGNVGMEVGAVFLQNLTQQFFSMYEHDSKGKEMDNIIQLFAHLYNFKVAHSALIFDVINKLVQTFREKDIELLLLLLRNVGFTLRKDDPNSMKEAILKIQSAANTVDTSKFEDQSRVKFMLEIILAIRNNNMRKIPNYDPEHLEHLRKLIRNYIRGSKFGEGQLKITLDDLRNAEEKGRWWIVGSAWEGHNTSKTENDKPQIHCEGTGSFSSHLLELAKKQRMNTEIRRNIFCVIMSSEDYVDAFEKLMRLGLKPQQEREIILVILDCCLQEKEFNPFYAYLGQKFCEADRRFQISFQFSFWDKFKELKNFSEHNRCNLGKFITHLLATKAMSLSLFKTISFGTLEKPMVHLLKQILTDLLLNYPDSVVEAVFHRIAVLNKLHLLHEGLRLFMHHFLLRQKHKDGQKNPHLKEKVEIADRILSTARTTMLL